MRIRYLVRLKKPIQFEDHWPIPVLGGELRPVSEGNQITAFEITFSGQSVDHAPTVAKETSGDAQFNLTVRDSLKALIQMQMKEAFVYIQCYFNVEILLNEIEAEYTAENEMEEKQMKVFSFSSKKSEIPIVMPYDFFARALLAAEHHAAPSFEAILVNTARGAMSDERYIDSFRYSFILIEALYGEGKFKKNFLKEALKANSEFMNIVAEAIKQYKPVGRPQNSDTKELLSQSPSAEDIVDHLVEKRGFYFHGNKKRKNAWEPNMQKTAQVLCQFSMEVASLITHAAAASMFDSGLTQEFVQNAEKVGAKMNIVVKFQFRNPGESYDTEVSREVKSIGTKVTPKIAAQIARQSLENFENVNPVSNLKSVVCVVTGTGQKIFEMTLCPETESKDEEQAT